MKKILSIFLTLCMIVTMLPMIARAEEIHTPIGTSEEITAFAPLEETKEMESQGKTINDLELPKTVTGGTLELFSPMSITSYNIWVGDTQVTSDSLSGLGWSYQPETNTLILESANITSNYSNDNGTYGIYANQDLNIQLVGDNAVMAVNISEKGSTAIRVIGSLAIIGSGSITAIGGNVSGITNYGSFGITADNLTINSGTVVANAGTVPGNLSYGIYCNGLLKMNGGTITAIGKDRAMNKAPDLSGYTDVQVTASEYVNGTPVVPYAMVSILNYKFLKFEPATSTDVVQIKETGTSYESLQAAVDAVENGQTIQLLSNINLTTMVTVAKDDYKSFALDLNDKTLDGGNNTAITHNGTGAITIQGSGMVKSNNSDTFEGTIKNQDTGSIIISGGTVQNTGNGIYNYTTGTITVAGGTVSGNKNGITNLAKGTIIVSGGTVTGSGNGIFNNSGGIVNISGGTVKSTGGSGRAIYTNEGGNITISGDANVTSDNVNTADATISLWFSNHFRPITLTIRGGTIENTAGGNSISKRGVASGELRANISIPDGKLALIKGGGHAMNFAPTLLRATVTASTNLDGSAPIIYNAADITNYKHLLFEPGPDTVVTNLNLTSKLTAPVTGGTPETVINDDQYTGTIVWSDDALIFLGSTVYTATATLTAKDGYTFSDVAQNAFSHNEADNVVNSAGSGKTLTVTITFPQTVAKTPQDISYAVSTVAKTYGDAKFINPLIQTTLEGTITYESDDSSVATVDPTTGEVTIVAAGDGSATVTATASETSTHAQALASYTVIVAKKELILKADDKSMTKGDGLPVFTYTVTGLVNGDVVITPPVMSTTADTTSVGSFDITIKNGVVANAASYNITHTKGILTVVEQLFTVTVTNGTGGGNYTESATVTITANDRSGYTFIGWSGADVTFSDASKKTTTFIMPAKAVTVDANYRQNSSGGNGKNSSNDNNSNSIVTSPAPDKPNAPTQGEIKVSGKVDKKGNVTVKITDKAVAEAFEKALAEAKQNGIEKNGITVVLHVDTGSKTGSNIMVNLPKTVQDTIIKKKIVNTIVVVDNPDIRIGMDLATVQEINKQAKSDVNITATRIDSGKLAGKVKKAIGSRPVFDLKVNYGKGEVVQSFGTGSVSVTIPYTLGAKEKVGNVQAVYVDAMGKVHWLVSSVYDSTKKVLRFSTNHFSTYGIGYNQTNTAFKDITDHWAKEEIEFVASRGLLIGTSTTAFSPNSAITRGMFVTALGRLANVDVSSYTKSSFTDVKSDAYYMGYIEWASKNNIVTDTGNGTFSPNQSITREQIAVIMLNYTKATGFTLPKVYMENTFVDSTKISAYAVDAVKHMQMAGVIRCKSGNQFDPQSAVTRAEGSAILFRFVELTISSDNMQGWEQNDSGEWLYYKNGKPLTGTQIIDGIQYFFNTNQVLKTGWVETGAEQACYHCVSGRHAYSVPG